ncbi:MAG: phosphonate metabolism protein/1,5-bisphosphokinase (PRPP-forming) PhnN [Pseudorhodoplanes sp.]|nr:phosphonate metabolism protein/1,5-bisphosphokinase (PRPP-forming) PhnN [Pseudorhodoplanes sp.]
MNPLGRPDSISDAPKRVGPGALVAVCGPSGAGKDTLIALARARSAADPNVIFARRVVTRPQSGFEDHDSLSDEAFDRDVRENRFAFWWTAHGLKYGIPAAVDDHVAAGRCVVCNVSRAILGSLRERYARVLVVLVTAPPEILAARLGRRGRASDGSLEQRLARSTGIARQFAPDVVIHNDGTPERGAADLLRAIDSQFIVFSV